MENMIFICKTGAGGVFNFSAVLLFCYVPPQIVTVDRGKRGFIILQKK